jgi:hypothetical protein
MELAELDLLAERATMEQWIRLLDLDRVPLKERVWRIYREKDRLRRKLRRRCRDRCL